MIITRTPFRVSFCGGGSDLPSFYKKHSGCVLSTTIDKYIYLSIHPSFQKATTALKYSQTEIVKNLSRIKHKIFRQCLTDLHVRGVEISSIADIPAGTGLGSSSAFTVGLLHLLYCYKGESVSKERLAREACEMEIEKLGEPIGKQDQYAAAYGGLNFIRFNCDGSVSVEPVIMNRSSYEILRNNLMMFYTGDVRSASSILVEQGKNITAGEKEKNQQKICALTKVLKKELENNNVDAMGEILHESWLLKRTLATGITNPDIDRWYETARKKGAIGGKLLGAGGGGFLLLYVPEKYQQNVRDSLYELSEVRFGFDWQGSAVIYVGDKPKS